MKTVKIELAGNVNFNPEIRCDGKLLKYKKAKYNHQIYKLKTDKDEVELEIYKWNEEENKNWIILELIYFFVSFFGIFDVKKNKNLRSIKYKGKIKLNDNKDEYYTVISLNSFVDNGQAFVVKEDQIIEDNETNKYVLDMNLVEKRKKLKKIEKILRIVGLFLVAIIVLLICIL